MTAPSSIASWANDMGYSHASGKTETKAKYIDSVLTLDAYVENNGKW